MDSNLDYVAHLARESARFADAAQVTGAAADLDCWLWHRPPLAPVERSGDHQVLSGFDSAIGPGIN